MNMVREKRGNEISIKLQDSYFDSIQGPGPLSNNDVPFSVNTLGRPGRVRGTGRP